MKIFILGAGGHARETYCHLKDIDPSFEILFIDDVTPTKTIHIKGKDIEVVKTWPRVIEKKALGFESFVIGIGDPKLKPDFIKKALDNGLKPSQTWIHPKAIVQDAKLGLGGMIAPGVVVTCGVTAGDYVVLNYNSTVGHDSRIGDFSTCNPGSNVSGNVTVGKSCLIGAGAVIKEKISIADNVIVGAQACVVKDIKSSGKVFIGVPAREH